jgi:hypothetical protein
MAPRTGGLPLAAIPALRKGLERAAGRAFKKANRDSQAKRGDRMWQVSMSDLGGCPREAAYRLAEVPPTDPELAYDTEARQALIGTWIHEKFLPYYAAELATADVEMPVKLEVPIFHPVTGEFVRTHVVEGTTDLYTSVMGGGVMDLKTLGAYLLGGVEHDGVREEHRKQVRGYATAIRQWGMPVAWVAWLYMDRANGEVAAHIEPFDEDAEAATEEQVRYLVGLAQAPDAAPRGHRGPGLSWVCDGCAWLKACFGPDAEPGDSSALQVHTKPEIAFAAQMYAERRAEIGPIKKDQEMFAAMVGRPEPGVYGDMVITYGKDYEEVDKDAAVEMLALLGAEIPMKPRRGNRNIRYNPGHTAEE